MERPFFCAHFVVRPAPKVGKLWHHGAINPTPAVERVTEQLTPSQLDVHSAFVAQPDHPLPLDDRGLQYGHGLFETVRVVDGIAPLFERHLQRALSGLAQLQLPADESQLRNWFSQILTSCSAHSGVVKILLTAGSGGVGYSSPAQFNLRCRYSLLPLPATAAAERQHGVQLWRCSYRLPHNPALAGVKHLNRLDQLLARSQWPTGQYGEGLLQCQSGAVVEATAANLFLYRDGQWRTPLIDRCGVRGVLRDYLLQQLLPSMALAVSEERVTEGQLQAAEEVFICNALRGVVPVTGLSSGERWPLGERTAQLSSALAQALPGYAVEPGDAP